jgi:hypothetical protein
MDKVILFLYSLFFIFPGVTFAAMTSTDYEIYSDSFSVGGASEVTGTTYNLSGLSGELAISTSTDAVGTYVLRGGFEASEKGILSASLDNLTIALGTLSASAVSTASTTLTVSTDSETGYSASITEDGNLRSGLNDIDDVGDGAVTAGSEEYGVRTSGSDGLLASDTAISGQLSFASAGGAVTNRQTTIVFRASMSALTASGSYTHAGTVTVTVNP